MGNEQGKDQQTAAQERTATTGKVADSLTAGDSSNHVQGASPSQSSLSQDTGTSPDRRKPSMTEAASSERQGDGSGMEVEDFVDDIKELSNAAKDTFNSKLKQTISIINTLKGSGDECHPLVITNADGMRLAGYHWKPRAFKIGGKKVRMPGGPR